MSGVPPRLRGSAPKRAPSVDPRALRASLPLDLLAEQAAQPMDLVVARPVPPLDLSPRPRGRPAVLPPAPAPRLAPYKAHSLRADILARALVHSYQFEDGIKMLAGTVPPFRLILVEDIAEATVLYEKFWLVPTSLRSRFFFFNGRASLLLGFAGDASFPLPRRGSTAPLLLRGFWPHTP